MLRKVIVASLGCTLIASASAQAQIEDKKFNVIGTWNFINNWKKYESPFWSEQISQGFRRQDHGQHQVHHRGEPERHRVATLLKTGVYDIVAALPIYVDDGGAVIEAVRHLGFGASAAGQRKILEQWMPEMQKVMKERYNSEIVATFGFPQQVFFCRDDINGIADLKGKKIRVQGVSQSDLAKAFGASAVTIPFGEVVPALEKGVVDCGITGTMPGYQANGRRWSKRSSRCRSASPHGIWVMNLNSFQQAFQADPGVHARRVQEAGRPVLGDRRKRKHRGHCLQHRQRSVLGRPARQLKLVKPSDADIAARNKALNEVVLVEWAKRCGAECAAKWTEIVGKPLGLTAKAN